MVHPVQPGEQSHPISEKLSPQERQKLFELQFEIGVLGIYISVSKKDGSLKHQLSQLKDDVNKKAPPQMVTQVNQLIDQINTALPEDIAPFPPFQFSTEGDEVKALTNFALTFEKILNVAAKDNEMSWNKEDSLFKEASDLITNIAQIPSALAFEKLNALIEAANRELPEKYQLNSIGGKK